MTVAKLREYVNSLESKYDNAEIVTVGEDHGFYKANAEIETAEVTKHGYLFEYYSDDDMEIGSKKVKVLVIH